MARTALDARRAVVHSGRQPSGLLERRVLFDLPAGWGTRWGLGKRPDRNKAARWRQLEYLRQYSVRGGARSCMMPGGDLVTLAVTASGRSHISGVERCGSSASCPVCTPVIRMRRAAEIEQAVEAWRAAGKAVVFVTATLPHQKFHSLAQSLTALQGAWSSIWRGTHGKTLNAAIGGKHRIRTIEATYGEAHGWHPHVHALLFLDVAEADVDVEEVQNEVGRRWRRAVGRETWTAADGTAGSWRVPTWAHGCVVKLVNSAEAVADYVTKVEYKEGCKVERPAGAPWGPAQEVVMSDRKNAGWGEGRRTPWDLLAEAAEGDASASVLYREWETETKGRQLIQWTRGAKAALGIDEVTDDEAATVDPAEQIWCTVEVAGSDWVDMLAGGRVQAFLDQIEVLSVALLGLNAMCGHPPPQLRTFGDWSADHVASGVEVDHVV